MGALSPQSLLSYIAQSLPPGSCLKDPYAAIAIFSHACMLAVGFRLIGLDEDRRIGACIPNFWRRPILTHG